jgi:hypothetical protein
MVSFTPQLLYLRGKSRQYLVGGWSYSSTSLDLGIRERWMVSFTPQLLYLRGKSRQYLVGGGEVIAPPLLTSVWDRGEWWASRPSCFTSGERAVNTWWGGEVIAPPLLTSVLERGALPPGREPSVPIQQEVAWTWELVWAPWRGENSCSFPESDLDPPARLILTLSLSCCVINFCRCITVWIVD